MIGGGGCMFKTQKRNVKEGQVEVKKKTFLDILGKKNKIDSLNGNM